MQNDVFAMEGDWVYVAPVDDLVLTKAVDREFLIGQVVFVAAEKIPRIRKRLGLHMTVSGYKKGFAPFARDFFTSAPSFAILWRRGKPEGLKTRCRRATEDALAVMCLSQLGYSKRRYGSRPRLRGETAICAAKDAFLNTSNPAYTVQGWASPSPLVADEDWRIYQKRVFFLKLLHMLYGNTRIARKWRNDLLRAAILAGRSQGSSNIPEAFLWNMISLELLLATRGDKAAVTLPKRAEAFLGWAGYWQIDGYEKRIEEVYKKRCGLVHSGAWQDIEVKDLLFTDDLLLNLLANIVHHQGLFTKKDALVEFADKVAAEHPLGIKSRVRPKTLRFIERSYTKQDLEEI